MTLFKTDSNTGSGKGGFTLIEALVALSILALVFTAFTSSVTTGIKSLRYAEEAHLASKMAKEGIELVVNKRNNHVSCVNDGECTDWKNNLRQGHYAVSSVRPEDLLPDAELSSHSGHLNSSLCFMAPESGHGGKFGYCVGPAHYRDGDGDVIPGGFKRHIEISSLGGGTDQKDPNGLHVKSVVTWRGGTQSVTLETFLYGS